MNGPIWGSIQPLSPEIPEVTVSIAKTFLSLLVGWCRLAGMAGTGRMSEHSMMTDLCLEQN